MLAQVLDAAAQERVEELAGSAVAAVHVLVVCPHVVTLLVRGVLLALGELVPGVLRMRQA